MSLSVIFFSSFRTDALHDAFVEARRRWRAADQRRERRKNRAAQKEFAAAEKILAKECEAAEKVLANARGDRSRSNSSANARGDRSRSNSLANTRGFGGDAGWGAFSGHGGFSGRGYGYPGFNSRFARGRGGRKYFNNM